jgi:CDP-diacylglycerol--glycerol-3-phosphate 3-phosphatidyltransferase
MGIGRAVGAAFSGWRDAIARMLVKLGVSPNRLTVAGFYWTLAAGACLAAGGGDRFAWNLRPSLSGGPGGSAYCLLAGIMLVLCSAGDMLDGAVARLGKTATTFGAFLDSTLDRFSDFAVFAGIAFYFAVHRNVTYTLLPMVALFASLMISYTRARAEDLIKFCTVGYWQRGERMAAVLIGVFAHNLPAMLWQQALLPLLTVYARIVYTQRVASGKPVADDPGHSHSGWDKFRLWRFPRMSWQYDLVTAINIAWLIFARIPAGFDPISRALGL